MLKRYKIYNESNEDEEYKICSEHSSNKTFSLCGSRISDTLDGKPEETEEPITCDFCIQTIKEIKEL